MKFKDLKKSFEDLKNSKEALKTIKMMDDYEMELIQDCLEGLYQRSPYKEDEKVRLSKTPIITERESWGWMGCRHFLRKNSVATVRSVEFHKGNFYYYLVFEKESYINQEGKKIPIKDKSLFGFSENWIKKYD